MAGRILLTAALLFLSNTVFVSLIAQNTFKISRGERPSINIQTIPDNAYEKGIIYIKLKRAMEASLKKSPVFLNDAEIVQFNIPSIDQLNQKYKTKKFKKAFESKAFSADHAERHEAWGFHLWYTLYFDENTDVKELLESYQLLDEVEIAEPAYKTRQVASQPIGQALINEKTGSVKQSDWTPNDPMYDQQWHYHNTGQQSGTVDADIDLPEAWDIEKGNSNVIVSIQDGGIQYDHPDIAGNMWSGIGYDFYNDDATIEPANHGTHVAGTVAAVNNNGVGISGIAGGSGSNDGIRLMSCQVFIPAGGSGANFHLAPVYAADNGACISQNSWSYSSPGSYNIMVLDAIDYFNTNGGGSALLNGGITIYSAGNDNSSGEYYPAFYSGTLSVAATNNVDARSWYSNYGSWVDISAPGGETAITERGVLSTIIGDSYAYYQGTSMACPHTSGVAALVASLSYGTLTPDEVKTILLETTDDHYAANPSYPGLLGSGRLNARLALEETQNYMLGLLNPSSFTATPVNSNMINLSWTKNPNSHDVLIVWSATNDFGDPVDGTPYTNGQTITGGGTVLYSGSNTAVSHLGLTSGTMVYYKAFSFNSDNDYSSGKSANSSTHCSGISVLPWTESFEDVGPVTTFDAVNPFINNLCRWSYDMGSTGGRLRFEAGDKFFHSGSKAATLDRNPNGDITINYLVTELDLSDYTFSEDLELSFYYMHHGEEGHSNDRVWIRGSSSDPWIEIYNLFTNQGGAGTWNMVSSLDIDAALSSATPAQSPGATFQLRFGQEDNYPATSIDGSDGYTFDDISITGTRLTEWTGSESTDWDTPGNWFYNMIPTAEDDVRIPASASNWPVKTGDLTLGTTCNQLTLEGFSELSINGNLTIPSGYILTHNGSGNIILNGDWVIEGNFIPGTSTVILNGSSNSSIDALTIYSSLQTTFFGGNGSYGNMFDIVALKELKITNFDANLNLGTGDVSIYYKSGTWVGFDNDATAWTLIGTTSVTSSQQGAPTSIPIPVNVTIPEGERYAFYIHTTNGIRYTSGSGTGNIFASDGYMQFIEGAGKAENLFAFPTYSPRVFNGIIHYNNSTTSGVNYHHLFISKNNSEVQNKASINVGGNLTINPAAWLTNNTTSTIEVSGNLLLEADVIGIASYIDKGTTTVAGMSIMEQHVSYIPPFLYHGVSAPISDATINTYLNMFLYTYDEPTNDFTSVTLPVTTPMPPGTGFYVTGSDQYTGTTKVSFETSTPTGKFNTSDLTINDFTVDGPDPQFEGFRLIGNPFPSALQWNSNWNMNNFSGWMIIIHEGSYKGYHTDGTGWQGGTDVIPPTQGFWVRALDNTASITIPESERIHSTQNFYKDKNEYVYPIVRMEVNNSEYSDETVVVFHPEGSAAFDGFYDLTKFSNPAEMPQLSSYSEGVNYAFNALDEEYADVIVPLYFSTGSAGTYQFTATEINNFSEQTVVYLEDIKATTYTNLNSNPVYEFDYNTQENQHMFNLHFKDSSFGSDEIKESNIRIFSFDQTVSVQSPVDEAGEIVIYDILGVEKMRRPVNTSGKTLIHFAEGMGYYLVAVEISSSRKTEKVFIK